MVKYTKIGSRQQKKKKKKPNKTKKNKKNKARDYKGGGSCLKDQNSRLTSFECSVKITGYFQGLMPQDQFSISHTDLQLG